MKFRFDLLEIKTLIEEKRLIFGLKFEKFLQQKFQNFVALISSIVKLESFAIFGCVAVVLISIYIRSTVDIGQDSGLYLEVAQKILDGKQYYRDFVEYNFPLAFVLLFPALLISKFLGFSPIVIADYYINILGIISLFWSYKILKNSKKIPDQFTLNLLILSLACGFFLRVNTLIFNEYLTKTSFILALIYPYFCYQIFDIDRLNKSQKIIVGALMALIVAIKPTYIILIAGFELYRFWRAKKLGAIFCLHNYVFAIFLVFYALILWVFFKSFLENFSYLFDLCSSYRYNYRGKKFYRKYAFLTNEYVLYIIIYYLYLTKIIKNEYFSKTLILSISVLFLVFFESFYLDQMALFYALFLPLVVLGFQSYVNQNKINLLHHWIVIIPIAIFSLLGDEFFEIILFFLTSTPFLMALIVAILLRDKIFDKHAEKIRYLTFIFVVFLTVNFLGKYVRTVLVVDSKNNEYAIRFLKSPNNKIENLNFFKNKYIRDGQNIAMLNPEIEDSYPFLNYAKIANNSEILQYDIIKISLQNPSFHSIDPKFYHKAKLNLLRQINDKNNKLLISFYRSICSVSVLEFFLRDSEIKNSFVTNFSFLAKNQSTYQDDSFVEKYTKDFLNEKEFEVVSQINRAQTRNNLYDDFEVYIRK